MRLSLIMLGLCLSACAEFPEVDAAFSESARTADYPELVPFEELSPADQPRLSETDGDALRARAAALRGRAEALRGPVIDQSTRDRMARGVIEP